TTAKFVTNPYKVEEKIYRSGDLARMLSNGDMEYLGRMDHQVKIRGFRIELGEVESSLLKIEGVKEVVVLDKGEEGSKYLCAYYVGEKEYSVGELREELKKSLPEYMIPSYFIQLEKMPLTANGKIDRKSLPEPDGNIAIGTEYEGARNETEEKLVKIWSEILGVEKIGINHNFFELGGHSLKATSLLSKIHKELEVEVPLKEIFKSPTIKRISEYIQSTEKNIYEQIKIIEEKEYYQVSSAQKRMYILQQFDLQSTSYNMPGSLEILGNFEIERMKEAFIKLIKRHEALRTSFYVQEDKIVQKVYNAEELNFEIEEIKVCSEAEVEIKTKDFIKPFDL
ncbi:non-ribosomal peptide synthetase, partial [Clostridium estertheticum]|uniref:condensation domain-containing protein n=1 Tax=Clostridium estertheticum TaxID=238834 RepID=UPI00209AF052